MGEHKQAGVVEDYKLALLNQSVFDIGPRTRYLMLLFGVLGIVVLAMESLVGGTDQTISLDKIIHFSGYFVLSLTFVLALRPVLFIPGLIGLVVIGVTIEFLQRHTGRNFDWNDAYANTLGVAVGGFVGLATRRVYSYIRQEVSTKNARKRLYLFERGKVLLREGDPVYEMCIIRSGKVQLTREVDRKTVEYGTLETGDVLGIVGVVEGKPQFTTITALERTVIYQMTMAEIMEDIGGKELPISLVLRGMSKKLRESANRIAEEQ